MPNYDQTGPLGQGQGTGRGMGSCGLRKSCGRGFKRCGSGFRERRNMNVGNKVMNLDEEERMLQAELKRV